MAVAQQYTFEFEEKVENKEGSLPEGWKKVKVKEIAESIKYGYTESSSFEEIGPKFLRITDIQDFNVNWDKVPFCKISNLDKNKYLLKDGDLVFARTGATVGKSFLIKGSIPEAVFASYLIRVRFNEEVLDKFVFNFFQSKFYWDQIVEEQVGIGQPNVNGKKLGEIEIPLPPLSEQQAIVAKIEQLFSELDKGKQQLETALQQLKVYRQAVLKWAFEGKFTNAEVKEGELPEGWKWVKLGEVTQKKSKKALPVEFPEMKFIGMDCIKPNTLKPYFLYDFKDFKSSGNVFEKEEVLYGRMRPYLNKVYKADFKGVCSGEFIILKCSSDLNPNLLKYMLHSNDFVAFANSITSGDRPRISYEEIADYLIPIGPISDQNQIVQEIESRLSVCDKVEETITQSLKQAETLRQSILKKAFEGKLI
jgi:type I restriction enzyme S subunit